MDLTENSRTGLIADIQHLLLTTKGTRYFRPSFGANLKKLLFDPNDEITHEQIRIEISNIITENFENVTVKDIKIVVGGSVSKQFNENLRGKKTSSKPPSTDAVAKVTITLDIKQGAFVSSEIIELQF